MLRSHTKQLLSLLSCQNALLHTPQYQVTIAGQAFTRVVACPLIERIREVQADMTTTQIKGGSILDYFEYATHLLASPP